MSDSVMAGRRTPHQTPSSLMISRTTRLSLKVPSALCGPNFSSGARLVGGFSSARFFSAAVVLDGCLLFSDWSSSFVSGEGESLLRLRVAGGESESESDSGHG